ncbi:hypothetical protein GCM10020256_19400 [Streptomyces thermocoprophilus]
MTRTIRENRGADDGQRVPAGAERVGEDEAERGQRPDQRDEGAGGLGGAG